MAAFAVRGVIEGFYGRPWSRDDRLDLLRFCAERGMNAYVYAPKNDSKHRTRWREAYTDDEQEAFADLSRHCRALGVRFGFALSPGLDIDYRSAADRCVLRDKLGAALDVGAEWLVVAFDDVPTRTSDGTEQGALVAWLHEVLGARDSGVRLSVVPTEYAGTWPSPYLADLAATLPPDVDVMWTGPHVVSPTIGAADAEQRAAAVGGRPPLLWDNYPVNDGEMRRSLFLGPYTGRDAALADRCSGVLCNPMPLAHASKVGLATAAEFFEAPRRYQPAAAWQRAIGDVGGPGADVLGRLAAACADSALAPPSTLPGHGLLDRFEAGALSLGALGSSLGIGEVVGRERLAPPLEQEVGPWLDQLELEARAGRAAVDLLEAVGQGDPRAGAEAAERLRAAWSSAWEAQRVNVLGPRFACYPVVGVNEAGAPTCDLRAAIVENASVIDRLCRLAAERYTRSVEGSRLSTSGDDGARPDRRRP